MNLTEKIEYSISLLKKSEKMALEMDPENGFYLAFSGGKDSQVLYHLAVMGGVKFKAHMNLTSVDPPEVIRFVKQHYPEVELIKPKMSIYDMVKQRGCLPTKRIRWCCEEFKEMSGAGKVTLIGVRREESVKRSKRNEVEMDNYKFSGSFDQWSEHRENMVTCVGGKDKIIVSPILYWTSRDVWDIILDVTYNAILCDANDRSLIEPLECPNVQWNIVAPDAQIAQLDTSKLNPSPMQIWNEMFSGTKGFLSSASPELRVFAAGQLLGLSEMIMKEMTDGKSEDNGMV